MVFKNRIDAGNKLLSKLKKVSLLRKNPKDIVVISILKGGIIVGKQISLFLKCPHFPLPVVKITSPYSEELALGALCNDFIYLNNDLILSLEINKFQLEKQINQAKEKYIYYLNFFKLSATDYQKIKGKIVILVDDGAATGATIKTGASYLAKLKPKNLIICLPVACLNLDIKVADKILIYHPVKDLGSVSEFYKDFRQITLNEVKNYLNFAQLIA